METIDRLVAARAHGERPRTDYAAWTVEELRDLARQLRVRSAAGMTRGELLELLAPPPSQQPPARQQPPVRQQH